MDMEAETARLVRYVSRLGHQYPELWKRVDRLREKPGWPAWCFMPSREILKLIATMPCSTPNLRTNLNAVAALASWRVTQGIYRFDPDLFEAVWDTPLDRQIPCEMLFRLPEWCVYIMTPGAKFAGSELRGFFAYLDHDSGKAHSELRILLDAGESQLHAALPIDLSGNNLLESLEASRERSLNLLNGSVAASDRAILAAADMKQYARMVGCLVNLLVYVSSTNAEIFDAAGRGPSRPAPKATRKGRRLFPPNQPAEWQVGFRLGAALRNASAGSHDRVKHADPSLRASPRPHFRRAHWHSYWTGPVASAEDRNLSVKWIPPTAVNVKNKHQPIPVYHVVTGEHGDHVGAIRAR